MASYDPISTLSELLAQQAAGPLGTEAASKLDDAVRQLQGFLYNFLAVSHDNTGRLKAGSITSDTFILGANGVVPTSALQGDIDGSKITADSIDTSRLESKTDANPGAVATSVIQDLAVTSAKLADDAVIAGKIAAGGVDAADCLASDVVETAKIKNLAVTDAKLAANAVTSTKVSDGAIGPTKLLDAASVLGAGELGLPVLSGNGASSNVVAKIGGAVTATYNPTTKTLEFALGATSDSTVANIGRFTATATGTNTASAWTPRQNWFLATGSSDVFEVASTGGGLTDDKLVVNSAGTYLILVNLPFYSVEAGQVRVKLVGSVKAISPVFFCPIGAGQNVCLHAYTVVATAGSYFTVEYYTTRSQTSNGLGYNPGALEAHYGEVVLVKVA